MVTVFILGVLIGAVIGFGICGMFASSRCIDCEYKDRD